MLRDAGHHQAIQKFSFIESLNLSRINRIRQSNKIDSVSSTSQESNHQTENSVAKTKTQAVAIVASAMNTTFDSHWYESNSDEYSLNLAEVNQYFSANEPISQTTNGSRNYLGKILFALACSYCLFVLWWLFGQQVGKILTTMMGGEQITLSKADAKFIDYVERSLDNIDRLEANNHTNGKEGIEQGIVYVPVYTPNPDSNLPQSSNNLPQSEPLPPEALKIPEPPPLPASPPPETTSPPTPAKIAVATKPPARYILTGILDLGANKSTVLVEVNGQTRRIGLGEEINNSGWILESVQDQSVNISYQGQVHAIAVGETF